VKAGTGTIAKAKRRTIGERQEPEAIVLEQGVNVFISSVRGGKRTSQTMKDEVKQSSRKEESAKGWTGRGRVRRKTEAEEIHQNKVSPLCIVQGLRKTFLGSDPFLQIKRGEG